MPNTDPNITAQIETFTQQLVATVEAAVTQRIQAALAGAFGVPQKRGPGRPPKQAVARVAPVAVEKSAGKKTRPKQLCPVPGCKNPAAPIFGMVCKDHKNVAKSKIKKYRKGLNLITAGTRRNSPAAVSPSIKSLNYLNNILAKIEAINAGTVEALMLNGEG